MTQIMNPKKRATLASGGIEYIKDFTSTRIPLTLLMLLRGLRSLTVLIADTPIPVPIRS